MRHVETTPGMRGGGIKENDEEMNSTMIYCKNFVNVTMYLQYNNMIIIKMKIQIKTLRFLLTLVKMAIIKKTNNEY
jgi:hypothetical protein